MSVLLGAARMDENNDILGKTKGDQTTHEVEVHNWYDHEWQYVLRPIKQEVADKSAKLMAEACANKYIGYSQKNRLELYYVAKANGFKISAIKTPCDCDCSSLVATCAIGAGVSVSPDLYTGNEVQQFRNSGDYEIITKQEYLRQSCYLKRGDILVTPYSHTAMVLSNGSKVQGFENDTTAVEPAKARNDEYAGVYRANTDVYIRRGAGKQFKAIAVLKEGEVCRNYGYYTRNNSTTWLYIKRMDIVGYISANFLTKI